MDPHVLRITDEFDHVEPEPVTVVLGIAELESGQAHAGLVPLPVHSFDLDEAFLAGQWVPADDVVAGMGLCHLLREPPTGLLVATDGGTCDDLNPKVVFRRRSIRDGLALNVGLLAHVGEQSAIPLLFVLRARLPCAALPGRGTAAVASLRRWTWLVGSSCPRGFARGIRAFLRLGWRLLRLTS